MQELTAGVDLGLEEIGELYTEFASHIRQIVRAQVRAPDPVIEDACQIAWSRLLGRRPEIRREVILGWLVTTANREALRLLRHGRRELPLDELGEGAEPSARMALCSPAADEIVAQRSRLDAIRALPRRQQRLVWLQGFGLSYREMAGYTASTPRTVERQLLRAKRALRAASAT